MRSRTAVNPAHAAGVASGAPRSTPPAPHEPDFKKNMSPFNFITAIVTLGVTFFYVAVNGRGSTGGGEGYLRYRNAFCVAVIFLSLIQIVRAFSPLEVKNNLFQIGVVTVMIILILWIKTFEIIAEHQPSVAAKILFVALIFAAIGALFLPGGGYWGEATSAAWAGLTAVLERTLAAQGNSHSGAVE